MNYRKEVDGLRALAILLVISFHAFGLKGGFVGDSYSNSYTEMLARYSQTNLSVSFTQIGRGECPLLMDYGPEYCKTLSRKSFEFIAHNKNIKTVILASDWPAYIQGKKYADMNYYEDTNHFKEALEKTIKSYQGIGKNILVFLSPPPFVDERTY